MPYVVGLTGGIGSGKSAVAAAFDRIGVEIVDADLLAHRLSARGEAGFDAVLETIPDAPLTPGGELDRTLLRQRVFDDPPLRARLERALHPLIGAAARRQITQWRGDYGIAVVPLLLERGGMADVVDRVLVVDCPEDEQLRRVVARSGMPAAEVRAIMATQLSRASRLAAADDVIDNAGAIANIASAVAELDLRYRALARAPAHQGT